MPSILVSFDVPDNCCGCRFFMGDETIGYCDLFRLTIRNNQKLDDCLEAEQLTSPLLIRSML